MTSNANTKLLVALVALLSVVTEVHSDILFSPRNGNAASGLPFFVPTSVASSVRYQQVYGASDFLRYPNQSFFITELSFTFGPGSSGIPDRNLTNLQVNFSTTQKMPDGLSLTFSENIGPDDQVARSGSFLLIPDCCESFSVHIPLEMPFLYDPALGNLLLDVRNFHTADGPPFPPGQSLLLTKEAFGDTASYIFALDVNSPTARPLQPYNTAGLVTLFTYQPIPKPVPYLAVSRASTNLVVRWAYQTGAWTLQQNSVLGADGNWQPAGGVISTNGEYKKVTLPLNANVTARFFRLVLPTSGGPAGAPDANSQVELSIPEP